MSTDLGRRRFLRGAGGVVVGLPFLETLAPRRALAATRRKRLVVFQVPQGVVKEHWYPAGGGREFTLNRIMAPLQPHKADLTIFRNIEMMTTKTHDVLPTLTGTNVDGPR